VPSEFSVVVGFVVRGQPDERFRVSTDVLSHMGKTLVGQRYSGHRTRLIT
jgi:hypothetical protein